MRYLLCVDGSLDSIRALEHLSKLVHEKDEVYILHSWKPLDLPPTVQMVATLSFVALGPNVMNLTPERYRLVHFRS